MQRRKFIKNTAAASTVFSIVPSFVLGKNQEEKSDSKSSGGNRKEERRAAAERRKQLGQVRKDLKVAEKDMEMYSITVSAIDKAMFDPSSAEEQLAGYTMTELMKLRAEMQDKLEKAEAKWMDATETLETESENA